MKWQLHFTLTLKMRDERKEIQLVTIMLHKNRFVYSDKKIIILDSIALYGHFLNRRHFTDTTLWKVKF